MISALIDLFSNPFSINSISFGTLCEVDIYCFIHDNNYSPQLIGMPPLSTTAFTPPTLQDSQAPRGGTQCQEVCGIQNHSKEMVDAFHIVPNLRTLDCSHFVNKKQTPFYFCLNLDCLAKLERMKKEGRRYSL